MARCAMLWYCDAPCCYSSLTEGIACCRERCPLHRIAALLPGPSTMLPHRLSMRHARHRAVHACGETSNRSSPAVTRSCCRCLYPGDSNSPSGCIARAPLGDASNGRPLSGQGTSNGPWPSSSAPASAPSAGPTTALGLPGRALCNWDMAALSTRDISAATV